MNKFNWKIDCNSKTSLYLQVRDQIKKSILNMELKSGMRLSQRVVADIFGVSKMPVAEAFNILEAEGLIQNKPQSGAFVTNNIWAIIEEQNHHPWLKYISLGNHKDMPEQLLHLFQKYDKTKGIQYCTDKIAEYFQPEKPLIKAMELVQKRLANNKEIGGFNCCGLQSLRKTIATFVKRYGIETQPENILITQGLGESMNIISNACLRNGINFFYETPSFLDTIMTIHSTGCNIERIPMDNEGIDIEKLIPKLKRSKSSILYVQPTNHCPTGLHMSKDRRNNLLAISDKFNVAIIENDMYRDFIFDNTEYPRPLKAFDKSGTVVYIGSLWNPFMGYKTSWIIANEYMIERFKYIKTSYELISNTINELITDEILSSGIYEDYMRELSPLITKHYYDTQLLLDKYLSKFATWRRNYPAYYIYLTFNPEINIVKLHQQTDDFLFFQGNMFIWNDTQHARLNIFSINPDMLETWIKSMVKLIQNNI